MALDPTAAENTPKADEKARDARRRIDHVAVAAGVGALSAALAAQAAPVWLAAGGGAATAFFAARLVFSTSSTEPSVGAAARASETSNDVALADYRRAFDAAPDPAVLLDGRGRILSVNDAARRTLGAPPIGSDLSALFRQPSLLAALADALATGAPQRVDFVQRGSTERWFSARLRPIASPSQGRAVAADDRARRLLDSDLSRARIILSLRDETHVRRAESLHRDFVANASHELKTPLAAFTGFVETLLGPAADDPAARRRFLGIMGQQAKRMTLLVQDLMSLNRIELTEHVAPQDRVDIDALAREIAGAMGERASAEDATIELDLPTKLPDVVGDRSQLVQAIENLLSNAVKYGQGRRRPRIRAADPMLRNGQLGLTVEDFGGGVPKDHLPRLTERFYRVEEGTTKGTGLGLAIVKHIMARHRGSLQIESALGRGSQFTLWIPVWPTDARDATGAEAAKSRS